MAEIKIREIEENDLEKGFLESLDFLRKASDIDKNKAKEIFLKILDDETTNNMPLNIIEEAKKEFDERLIKIDWEKYHDDRPFNPSALSLYKWAPIADELKTLDVLAHPAAIQGPADASSVKVEDWDNMFAVNVRVTMLTNQNAFKYMKKNGSGSIINFGSISGLRPEPSASAYSAAKGAVHSWTRTAAGTWGKHNIRVNAILPAIATPMYYAARERSTDEENTVAHWRNSVPIALGQEYGDPDNDLAPVMVFFASDASKFITGQLIPVDGGQTAGL